MSEQFEHNIRKKLQDAEIPFEPMAWERMEKLLDEPNRRRPIWWWLSGLVLILGLGGWWFFSQQHVENPGASSENKMASPEGKNETVDNTPASGTAKLPSADDGKLNVDNPSKSSGSPSTDFISKGENSNDVDKGASTSPSPFLKKDIRKMQAGKNGIATNGTSQNRNNDNPDVDKVTSSSLISKNGNPDVNNSTAQSINIAQKNGTGNPDVNKWTDPPKNIDQKTIEINSDVNKPAPAIIPPQNQADKKTDVDKGTGITSTPGLNNPSAETKTDSAQSNPDPWKAPRRKGFEGGIFLGPDVNATGSFVGTKIGFTGGLLLRYHVNNRWFISTGAAYTKKMYGASPDEYKVPGPAYYIDIDADCDVIDVPLNLHYVFAERPTGRWNVSAGASTYFMLREKYDYYYTNYPKRTRVYSNQNQHWFSVINLSAGWEKNTKGRLNWGLQPYVKIPAGGVGEGKVKLYSAGVSLQVTLGKK
ncbi:porin family protein [Chitinophaga rhizosphaerae]|uniref:porin family protein n=1 Tax=Chitinophaga rhizosphaerae TaxID=1864947 RepID=UPI000F809DD4|nr:porin family protein [Chitinophaga rhizosphaerae]